MSSADFDDFALLWQEEPTAAEKREFRGLADKAVRRAQLLEYGELGLGLVLIVAVLIAIFMAPAPATIAIGALSIGALTWSSWKRHLLSQVALMMDTSDRRALVGREIVRAKAKLRRSAIGLWLFFPGLASGAALTYILRDGSSIRSPADAVVQTAMRWPEGPAVLFMLLALFWSIVRNHLRLKSELANLQGLSEDYREEARLDAVMLG